MCWSYSVYNVCNIGLPFLINKLAINCWLTLANCMLVGYEFEVNQSIHPKIDTFSYL